MLFVRKDIVRDWNIAASEDKSILVFGEEKAIWQHQWEIAFPHGYLKIVACSFIELGCVGEKTTEF